MKKQILIIMLILLTLLTAIPAQAQTIQMANPDATAQRDIIVYWPNGTLYGSYNTTSIITLDSNYSYIFTLKPQGNNAIDDPTNWLTNTFFPMIRNNAAALLIVAFLIGWLVGRRS